MGVCWYDDDDHPGDTAGVTASQMPEADLASTPAQHLLDGPPMQLAAADSSECVYV